MWQNLFTRAVILFLCLHKLLELPWPLVCSVELRAQRSLLITPMMTNYSLPKCSPQCRMRLNSVSQVINKCGPSLPNLSLQFPYDIRGRHTSHFFFYLPGYLSLVPPVCSLVPRSICMHAVQLYPSGAHLEALICHCFAALCIEWMCLSMFKWQKLCLLWVPSKNTPELQPLCEEA